MVSGPVTTKFDDVVFAHCHIALARSKSIVSCAHVNELHFVLLFTAKAQTIKLPDRFPFFSFQSSLMPVVS
jgi:hypothetical protein